MASYSRGYTVENRGAWVKWTCDREGCGAKGTERGDQADDVTEWKAAAHQQDEHYEVLIRQALEVLRDAHTVMSTLSEVVTDIDSSTRCGEPCVTPEAAADSLAVWAWQTESPLPAPDTYEDRLRWEWAKETGAKHACAHDTCNQVIAHGPFE
ncbi:hypothetical protein [Streptomyces jumonjinensis]|uniref:hypothetical protein n=1 Tax=Streptomyces jumonjinensis TaxID=1945 RepID=UPI0037B7000B